MGLIEETEDYIGKTDATGTTTDATGTTTDATGTTTDGTGNANSTTEVISNTTDATGNTTDATDDTGSMSNKEIQNKNQSGTKSNSKNGKGAVREKASLPVKRQLEGKIDIEAKKVRLQERREKTAAEQLLLENNQKRSQKLLEAAPTSPKSQLNEISSSVSTLMQDQVKVLDIVEQLSSRMDAIAGMATCQRCVKALYKDCLKRNAAPLTSPKPGTITAYMSPVSHDSASPTVSTPSIPSTIVDVDNAQPASVTDEDSSTDVEDHQAGTNGTPYIGSDSAYLGEARYGITVQKDRLHSARVTSKDGVKYALNLLEFIVTRAECQDKMTVSGEGRGTQALAFHKVQALQSEIFSHYYTGECKERQKKIWKTDIMPSLNNKIRGIRNGKYPGVSN